MQGGKSKFNVVDISIKMIIQGYRSGYEGMIQETI